MDRDLRRAWIALAGTPLAFVIVAVLGYGLIEWFGYSDRDVAPLWFALTFGLALILVAMAPAVAGIVWARHAKRAGAGSSATAALWVGILVCAYWIVSTVGNLIPRLF